MLLTTFGLPWQDARHLTLSFAPDGTLIAGQHSTLFQTLNAQQPQSAWEGAILRAAQTWAQYANIDIGVVPDGGQPFGTDRNVQGEPRFGDIRIGAQQMAPGVLALSVPPDPYASGTWSGAVLLNSAYAFSGPEPDLYSVMLHELGHALGVAESDDPTSVMHALANSAHDHLSAGDIAAIQQLYGVRVAAVANGATLPAATDIAYPQAPNGYDGTTPLVAFGDLGAPDAANFYRVQVVSGYEGPLTFRLQTSGISLLEPDLTVYDAAGQVVGEAYSTQSMGDVVSVTLGQVEGGAVYYAKVSGAVHDMSGVGRFGLAVTFDERLTVPEERIDTILRGPYDSLNPTVIDEIFRGASPLFIDDDLQAHSGFSSAEILDPTPGYALNSTYQEFGSLTDAVQQEYLQVTAPSGLPADAGVMTVTVNAFPINGIVPRVDVFDASGNAVPSDVLVNSNGTLTLQVTKVTAGANYYLHVTAASTAETGNFTAIVNFSQPTTSSTSFTSNTLSAAAPQQSAMLFVAQDQLFHFHLTADAIGAPPDMGVHMTIADSNGTVVFDLVAPAGIAVSADPVLLAPGAYTVSFTAMSANATLPTPLNYTLQGSVLSDPIGPAVLDPTLQPFYTNPSLPGQYVYPGGVVSKNPFYFVALVL